MAFRILGLTSDGPGPIKVRSGGIKVENDCIIHPRINVVKIPDGVDDAAVRKQLLEDFNLEIGAGLGEHAGKVWRIGLMGYACKPRNIDHCLAALRTVLK